MSSICFPQGRCFTHSVYFSVDLWNLYERGMQYIRHGINVFLLLQRFPDRQRIAQGSCVYLYKETVTYILSFFFPGDALLLALDFPSSLYWFEIYSCEIKDY